MVQTPAKAPWQQGGQRTLALAALVCCAWLAFLLWDGERAPALLQPAPSHWPTWEEARALAAGGGAADGHPGPHPLPFGALPQHPPHEPGARSGGPQDPQPHLPHPRPGQPGQAGPQPGGGCDPQRKYDLSHLVQGPAQRAVGPVQDDEALLLYAVARGMRCRTVAEIGGLGGYSARNFLQAMAPLNGLVYTVDLLQVPPQHPTRHKCIQKDVYNLTAADLDGRHVDLLFFDAHVAEPQMHLYHVLERAGLLDNDTVIALHDTNLHPARLVWWAAPLGDEGWVHQPAERRMVEQLRGLGWEAWSLHPPLRVHALDDEPLKFRHGLTLMQRHRPLKVNESAEALQAAAMQGQPQAAVEAAAAQAAQQEQQQTQAAGQQEQQQAQAAGQQAQQQQQQQQVGSGQAQHQRHADEHVVQAVIADPSKFTTARFANNG